MNDDIAVEILAVLKRIEQQGVKSRSARMRMILGRVGLLIAVGAILSYLQWQLPQLNKQLDEAKAKQEALDKK